MADYLTNLLKRSGPPPGPSSPASILQPRLPALFEPAGQADEPAAPPADLSAPSRAAPAQTVTPQPGQTPHQHPDWMSQEPPEIGTVLHLPLRAPAKADTDPLPLAARDGERELAPEIASPVGSRPAEEFSRPRRTTETALQEHAAKPQSATLGEAPADNGDAARTIRAETALRYGGPAPADPPQEGPGAQPVPGHASAARTIRPEASPVRQETVLAPARSVPALPRQVTGQAAQEPEAENIVQIHIGRIDVRAVPPPSTPPPAQPSASQPKMSLDEYLRKREAKR